ncbi:hypothetical protein J5226_10070 [Lysobacter sp. K5869]|uniref:hypothetical protein n=1 Tax=Lysobacter sp. K5869 TaxID=2820808 RepID=UPI001C05EE0D|nr:hypothetical protein [Lysobacter sp. K5869]QWP78709.1 hypothetical protein J5226_10070 [Lysobacter sp. K5869]
MAAPATSPPEWYVIWMPVIVAVVTVLGSFLGAYLASRWTRNRELEAQTNKAAHDKAEKAKKDASDAAYLAGLVAGELERFSSACEAVAFDNGVEDHEGYTHTTKPTPTFDRKQFDVVWSVLPPVLMFDVLHLPNRIHEADQRIEGAAEHDDPPDYPAFFERRKFEYAGLGIEAARFAAELRSFAQIAPRPANPDWDSVEKMTELRAAILTRWATPTPFPFDLPPQPTAS